MPVTVIVGGQYGSEGKGKVAHYLAREMGAAFAVRVGGSNSGHTVISAQGERIVFRHLPTPAILPNIKCALGAGSYINLEILFREIGIAKLTPDRLYIDPNAVIVSKEDIASEASNGIRDSIGSTGSGTGAAVIRRISRKDVVLAKDCPDIKDYVRHIAPIFNSALERNERIIVEGTQGFGLSVLHSPHFPYATSRDTTAAGFLSEAGLSPLDVDDIVLVIRAFPIRVSGNSGPLPKETTWERVSKESGRDLIEYTSVTKEVRRLALFDPEIVKLAILHNKPTQIVLNHLDYIDSEALVDNQPTPKITAFVDKIEASLGQQINYLGFNDLNIVEMKRPPNCKVQAI